MNPKTPKILLIANDEITEPVTKDMNRYGYDDISTAASHSQEEEYEKYDLVLIDLELPHTDGITVCRAIRRVTNAPIIALAPETMELDRILALQAGCDDCLTKPYWERELMVRIEAVLRRVRRFRGNHAPEGPALVRHGPLLIDHDARKVRLDQKVVKVTRKEFDLLYLLASQPQKVFSREELMREVWGYPPGKQLNNQASRTIDTHVSNLRNKLGRWTWVVTVRGVGFRIGEA